MKKNKTSNKFLIRSIIVILGIYMNMPCATGKECDKAPTTDIDIWFVRHIVRDFDGGLLYDADTMVVSRRVRSRAMAKAAFKKFLRRRQAVTLGNKRMQIGRIAKIDGYYFSTVRNLQLPYYVIVKQGGKQVIAGGASF